MEILALDITKGPFGTKIKEFLSEFVKKYPNIKKAPINELYKSFTDIINSTIGHGLSEEKGQEILNNLEHVKTNPERMINYLYNILLKGMGEGVLPKNSSLIPIATMLRDMVAFKWPSKNPVTESISLDKAIETFKNLSEQDRQALLKAISQIADNMIRIETEGVHELEPAAGPSRIWTAAGIVDKIKAAIKRLNLKPSVETIAQFLAEAVPKAFTDRGMADKLIKELTTRFKKSVELFQTTHNIGLVELSTVHGPVREASSLADDLGKVYTFFDEETPEVIRSVVNGIIRTDPTGEKLEKAHNIIKSEIKKLKNPLRRELLQYLVLMPIQEKLGRINPVTVDRAKKNQLFSDFKRLKVDREIQQKYTEKSMEEGLSKGAPSKQIKHLSGMLQKLAHLLIRNLH